MFLISWLLKFCPQAPWVFISFPLKLEYCREKVRQALLYGTKPLTFFSSLWYNPLEWAQTPTQTLFLKSHAMILSLISLQLRNSLYISKHTLLALRTKLHLLSKAWYRNSGFPKSNTPILNNYDIASFALISHSWADLCFTLCEPCWACRTDLL